MNIDSTADEKFMQMALEQSQLAKNAGDFPCGAVVVCDGKIVGKGHAKNNTTGDVTDHAELLAVRDACKNLGRNNLEDCVIYCTNEPCLMCAAGIFQADIPKVIIGLSRDDLPNFFRPRKLRIDNLAEDTGYKIEIIRGVLKEKVLDIFKDVQRNK